MDNEQKPVIVSNGGSDKSGQQAQASMSGLELQLIHLEQDVAVIKSNYVTKNDLTEVKLELKEDVSALRVELHQSITAQTKWIAATMITVAVMSIATVRLLF